MQPVKARMEITVEKEGDDYYVHNGLKHPAISVMARIPDAGNRETWMCAVNVSVGGKVKLIPLGMATAGSNVEQQARTARERFRNKMPSLRIDEDITLYAECTGIPYYNNGDLVANKITGSYFYVRVKSSGNPSRR